jgi:acrylyl-CoA reductase (NADPH)
MSNTFKAFRIHEGETRGTVRAGFEQMTVDELSPGDVVIRAEYSSINYKDALAATGAGRILRSFPLNGGIDVAGVVESSSDPQFTPGMAVLATGSGLGEATDGGYAEFTRVGSEWVVPIPDGLDARTAMTIGTAGFTAALAIHRMEHNGQAPENGPVVVTGATGGVGSVAVDMLSSRGYEVVAVSGKRESEGYLKAIGASRILWRDELDFGSRALESIEWAGAIDNVGGEMLTWLTRTMGWWGNIASIGLAGSHELHTTVMPFILRGVNLLGINSMATPRALRLAVWDRVATDLMPQHLDMIGTRELALDDLPDAFQAYVDGTVTGRTVVRIG